MTCEKCGVELAVSDWPFCPHGRGGFTIERDEIPGGQIFENGFSEPRRFDSHSAHRAALAENNMEQRVRWAGPEDKHVRRWDTVDLDSARVLSQRNVEAARTRNEARALVTVTQGDAFRATDLDG